MGTDQLSAVDAADPSTVESVPANNATLMVSDGADDYADGDVVIVGNWDGTEIAAVLGNLNDGTGLVSVDTTVSGDLGGLL